MTRLQYLPYEEAHRSDDDRLIAVDCAYPRGLALSHLYNQRVPVALRSNTSTQCALKWILESSDRQGSGVHAFVTANHWDIDGFLAVWSLLNPDLATEYSEILSAASMLGDFREFDPASTSGLEALKVCALLNHVEAAEFCLPFGDLPDATIEYQVARQKFEYFLPRFEQWLHNREDQRVSWLPEYKQVLQNLASVQSGEATIEEIPSMGISVLNSATPLHYYAAFSMVRGGGVLTLLPNLPYAEFEYRYETRVGRLDKEIISRVDLSPLAEQLNTMERAENVRWTFDSILEGGPILRPEFAGNPLSREDRYQSLPYKLQHGLLPLTSLTMENVRSALIEFLGQHAPRPKSPSWAEDTF